MLRLYHSPMACSLAARLALAASKLDHEIRFVRIAAGENRSDEYLAINPMGQVPALVTPDGTLTEVIAILGYIADMAPEKRLLPEAGTYERALACSRLSYLSATVHAAYRPVVRPRPGCDNDAALEAARDHLNATLTHLDRMMAGRPFVLDEFSLCDLLLLVLLGWRRAPALHGQLVELPELDRFQSRMLAEGNRAEVISEEMAMLFGASGAGTEPEGISPGGEK